MLPCIAVQYVAFVRGGVTAQLGELEREAIVKKSVCVARVAISNPGWLGSAGISGSAQRLATLARDSQRVVACFV